MASIERCEISGWRGVPFTFSPEGAKLRLRGAGTTAELFASAAMEALGAGFARAVVLTVSSQGLTAEDTAAVPHAPSEALRRLVLAQPTPILPGRPVGDSIRHIAPTPWKRADSQHDVLARTLGLERYAVGVVAPEARTLAIVVADRPGDEVDALQQQAVAALAAITASAVQTLVLRARLAGMSTQLRRMTAGVAALMSEMAEPVGLPSEHGNSASLSWIGIADPDPAAAEILRSLTNREVEIVHLMVDGHTNRSVANHLVLSVETVKGHVSRILRKLNASNRAEAVAQYLRLSHG